MDKHFLHAIRINAFNWSYMLNFTEWSKSKMQSEESYDVIK